MFREPKRRSKRVVPLPGKLVPLLKAHRAAQLQERMAAGALWEDHGLVFCQPDGRPIDPRADWAEWKDLTRAAGLPNVRVHDGRHTAATG